MDYQEFFSKYSYDRQADVVARTRFGLIYNAVETGNNDARAFVRVMSVHDTEGTTLEKEVEFVNALPACTYIQRYSCSLRFQESTGQVDCAVMDFYPLGNLPALLENWKLDGGERSGLRERILEAARFLRDNGVKLGQFAPETIYVSEDDGQLIPHLTDLSGVDEDNAGYESQVKALLGEDEHSEAPEESVDDDEAVASEESEAPVRTRKWAYLLGVILTWAAIIALIFILHRNRNSADGPEEAADTVKVEKVLYPADEFAKEEAARADSIEKARADSVAAYKADSAAYMKRMAEKAKVRKEAPKEPSEEKAPTADESVTAPVAPAVETAPAVAEP